jgi:hypothetical protein
MQIGDLVQTTLTGLDKPTRNVMGLLIKPIARSFWSVFLLEEERFICLDIEELEVISESR